MIESTVLVPSIKPHAPIGDIGMAVNEFLSVCRNHDVLVQSITIAVEEVTTAKVITGIGFNYDIEQPFVVPNENTNQ